MALEPMLIASDLHRPFHDAQAWNLLLKVGRALKPKHLIINGDYLDCFTVSSHSKSPDRKESLLWEIEDGNRGLDELDALGAKNKIFVGGNHEDRLRRYIEDKAPELFGLVGIPGLLNLKERGWAYTPYKRFTKLGKLHITHDVGSAGRFSTYRALDMFNHSVTTGHAHRMSYAVEGNAVGEYRVSAQFGWMGDVDKVDYMHLATAKKNWALGFGVGWLESSSGIVYLQPIPIIKGTCVVDGRLYKAAA